MVGFPIPPRPIVEATPEVLRAFLVWYWCLESDRVEDPRKALRKALQPYRGSYVIVEDRVVWLCKVSDRWDDVIRTIPRSVELAEGAIQ